MMTNRKDLIVAVLGTFCLTATLFMIVPTRSQSGSYDPWIDVNDDGSIDMADISIEIDNFMAAGTPIDKTALLLELQARMDSLNASLLDLAAYLETRITTLEASVAALESRITALETPGYMKAPAYDSGWLPISQGQTIYLTHNLNTDPAKLFMYVLGYHSILKTHQLYYGGELTATETYGLYAWNLTNTQIDLTRWTQDPYWEQVRVQIWIIR